MSISHKNRDEHILLCLPLECNLTLMVIKFIITVLLQLYVSMLFMFPSTSAPLIGETTTQIVLKQVKFRCNCMLFFWGGGREENVRI